MSSAICFYHQERQAVDKCERCNRLLCLEDKIKKNYTRDVGTGDDSYYVQYSMILCPLCDIDQELKARKSILNPLGLVFYSIFIIIPFIVGITFIGLSLYMINLQFNPDPTFLWAYTGPNYFIILFMIPFLLAGIGFGFILPFYLIKRAVTSVHENPDKINQLENKRRNFTNSITSPEAKKLVETSSLERVMTCFQCGSKIFPHEQFCSNCGDSTKEELKAYGQ